MEIIIQVLAWICLIIFAVTGLIAILSLVNVLKIKEEYRRKLFNVLILEIVGVCIWGFNTYLKDYSSSTKWNYVAITTPQINTLNNDIDTIIVDTSFHDFFINGVVQFDRKKNIIPKIQYIENDSIVYESELTVNPNGIFTENIPIDNFTDKTNCTLIVFLEEDDEKVKEYKINGYIRKVD